MVVIRIQRRVALTAARRANSPIVIMRHKASKRTGPDCSGPCPALAFLRDLISSAEGAKADLVGGIAAKILEGDGCGGANTGYGGHVGAGLGGGNGRGPGDGDAGPSSECQSAAVGVVDLDKESEANYCRRANF